jgi:probable addiction module antidote protein
MNQRINVDDLPLWDSAKYLDSEEAIAAYLADIREDNNAQLMAHALEKVTRARMMHGIPEPNPSIPRG